jgi:hypothetical protein
MKKTAAQEAERDEHMDNAMSCTIGIIRDAELRGFNGAQVAIAIANVLAARNPTLAGKVLVAVGDAIRLNPITKIITPTEATVQ